MGSIIALQATLMLGAAIAAAQGQSVKGRVIEIESQAPLVAQKVIIKSATRTVIHVKTDSVGSFIARLPDSGRYTVEVHVMGLAPPVAHVIDVKPYEVVEVELLVSPNLIPIDSLIVVGRAVIAEPYLESSGFYDRKLTGIGSFLDREQIQRHASLQLSDALRRMTGVRLVRVDGRRSEVVVGRGVAGRRCLPAVFVDGALARLSGLPKPTDLVIDDMVPVADVEGVEVYTGPAQTPPPFSRYAECGAIVIWTKRRI